MAKALPASPPAIVRRWRRLLAVGCSHGNHADDTAIAAVLRFRDAWKPHHVVHLGDFVDMTAFRAGARGNNDESEPLAPDVDGGLDFLAALRPTLILCGNHEARLWRWAQHHNAIVAECAAHIIQRIEARARKLGAVLSSIAAYGRAAGLAVISSRTAAFTARTRHATWPRCTARWFTRTRIAAPSPRAAATTTRPATVSAH